MHHSFFPAVSKHVSSTSHMPNAGLLDGNLSCEMQLLPSQVVSLWSSVRELGFSPDAPKDICIRQTCLIQTETEAQSIQIQHKRGIAYKAYVYLTEALRTSGRVESGITYLTGLWPPLVAVSPLSLCMLATFFFLI